MAADCRRVTPHRTPFATAEALRRAARTQLAEGRRAAARRTLLDALIRDPDNAAVRRDLAELLAGAGDEMPHATGLGLLTVIAAACAVLGLLCLLSGRDVSAVLLAVAGLYTGLLIARRRRRVA
jgi:hypothetical protein